jgi:hypothetical protein
MEKAAALEEVAAERAEKGRLEREIEDLKAQLSDLVEANNDKERQIIRLESTTMHPQPPAGSVLACFFGGPH